MQALNLHATAFKLNQTARELQTVCPAANDPFQIVNSAPEKSPQGPSFDLFTEQLLSLQEKISSANTVQDPKEQECLLKEVKELTDKLYSQLEEELTLTPLFPGSTEAVRRLSEQRTRLIALFFCLNCSCYFPACL